jgi:hypothetical protein
VSATRRQSASVSGGRPATEIITTTPSANSRPSVVGIGTGTVEANEEPGLPREISVAPDTATSDRELPVDAHAPHVVGHAASERFNAGDVITPLLECLPSH